MTKKGREGGQTTHIFKTSWVCRATLKFNYRLGLGWVGVGLSLGWGRDWGWVGLGLVWGKNVGPDKR